MNIDDCCLQFSLVLVSSGLPHQYGAMRTVEASKGLIEAIHILKRGGVVAHATETCYGLACDLANPAAVAKLFAIKQRPLDQPVSALFVSIEEAKKWVEWSDEAEKLAAEFLPGPLTLILPLRKKYIGKIFPIPRIPLSPLLRSTPPPSGLGAGENSSRIVLSNRSSYSSLDSSFFFSTIFTGSPSAFAFATQPLSSWSLTNPRHVASSVPSFSESRMAWNVVPREELSTTKFMSPW